MTTFDVIITGAGIVGLATAYELKKLDNSLKIGIIEKEKEVAKHQTGNNSGVIHSGVYYKPGSEKANNCLKGYDKMINFCKEQQIKYDLCGKLIIAKEESELQNLQMIYQRGVDKGMKDLEIVDSQIIKEKEPYIEGIKAINVPQAGIVDYSEVSRKLKQLLEDSGVKFFFENKVTNIELGNTLTIFTNKSQYVSKFLINCAGLYSDKLAELTAVKIAYKIIPFRGEYYKLGQHLNHMVNGLIYPVPNPDLPFLGVHLTKKLDGSIEAGPNAVLAFRREGYNFSQFNFSEFMETITYNGFHKLATKYTSIGIKEMWRSMSKKKFLSDLKTFIPSLTLKDIQYKGAGVRAQACDDKGNLLDDFLILNQNNIVNVCNAPSPAATSCFAIGETIARSLKLVTS